MSTSKTCQHCGAPLRWNGEWFVWACIEGCSDGDAEDTERHEQIVRDEGMCLHLAEPIRYRECEVYMDPRFRPTEPVTEDTSIPVEMAPVVPPSKSAGRSIPALLRRIFQWR